MIPPVRCLELNERQLWGDGIAEKVQRDPFTVKHKIDIDCKQAKAHKSNGVSALLYMH